MALVAARAALAVLVAALVGSLIAFGHAGGAGVCLVRLVVVVVSLGVVAELLGLGALPAAVVLAGKTALAAVAVLLGLLALGARVVLLAACSRADGSGSGAGNGVAAGCVRCGALRWCPGGVALSAVHRS